MKPWFLQLARTSAEQRRRASHCPAHDKLSTDSASQQRIDVVNESTALSNCSATIRRVGQSAFGYCPSPIAAPVADPNLRTLPIALRVAEVVRVNLACVEYAAASNGWLRAWALLWLRIVLLIACPLLALLVLALLSGVALSSMTGAIVATESLARHLALALLWISGAGGTVIGLARWACRPLRKNACRCNVAAA